MAGTIVAMGGISWEDEERLPLEDYWLGLTAAERCRRDQVNRTARMQVSSSVSDLMRCKIRST